MASPSTTAATPAGNCWRCGGQLYENLVHSCTTSVAIPAAPVADRPAAGAPTTEPTPVHLRSAPQPVTACGLTVQTPQTWKYQVPESGWVGPWREAEVTCPACLAAAGVST